MTPRSRSRSSALLVLYRLLAPVVGLVVRRLVLPRRLRAGKEDPERWGERLGRPSRPRPGGRLLWVHGASVGESLAALPVIGRVRAERPDTRVLVTTGTVTSAALLADRLPEGALHQFIPIDLPDAVHSFLRHWRPDAVLWLESEIWPTLLSSIGARDIPAILANARMSARSARRWRRWPLSGLFRDLMVFRSILAQSPEDAARFADLTDTPSVDAGNLKFAADPLPADPDELDSLRRAIGGRPVWVAASTHPGEESLIEAARARIAEAVPDLLCVLVPRHPRRGADVARALAGPTGPPPRRADRAPLGPDTPLYLADSLGEMGLWYRLADVVTMGGSLVAHGGQNPLEPARLGRPVTFGPHMENFARIAGEMVAAGAATPVADAGMLAPVVAGLLADPSRRAAMGAAARTYAESKTTVVDTVWEALEPLLDETDGGARAGSPTLIQ